MGGVIQSRVNDIIFMKYGVEEEDILPAITGWKFKLPCLKLIEFEKDKEIQEMFHQLQETIIKATP